MSDPEFVLPLITLALAVSLVLAIVWEAVRERRRRRAYADLGRELGRRHAAMIERHMRDRRKDGEA